MISCNSATMRNGKNLFNAPMYLHGLGAPQNNEQQAEQQAVVPRAGDKLWEIRCKVRDYSLPKMSFTWKQVGQEEVAIFCIMKKVLQLPSSSRPCLAAFVCQAVPGRIFVKAKTLQDAAHTALGIDELNSAKLQMVAEDKRTEIWTWTQLLDPGFRDGYSFGATPKICDDIRET